MRTTFLLLFISIYTMTFAQTDQDRLAIQDQVKNLQEAWNTKNTERWPNIFADKCDYIVINGTFIPDWPIAENQQTHQGLWHSVYKNSELKDVAVQKIDFIADGIAYVTFTLSNHFEVNGEAGSHDAIITAIFQKEDGVWKITHFHNAKVEQLPEHKQ